MKRLTFSVILILLTILAFGQSAKDFIVVLNNAGNGVAITGYTGKATTVRIPAQIEGMPVKEIGKQAFAANQDITNVVIPSGVVSIGDDAFGLCVKLTSISLPDSLNSVGKNAFMHTGLTSVTLPKSITSLSEGLFYNCRQLKSVKINGSITEIQPSAFASCISLVEIKLPASIQIIGERAFQACTSLVSVDIPNSAGSVIFGKIAFGECVKLNLATQTILKQRGYLF